MPERVVDDFEPVEVHCQNGKASLAALRPADFLAQAIHEEAAIGQPGERVVRRLMLQPRIDLLEVACMMLCTRLQMRIVDDRDQRDHQQRQCKGADTHGEPGLIQPHAAHAVGSRGKARCRHARVMHAADGQPHDDGRRDPGPSLLRRAVPQAEEQPQRDERGSNGDADGQRHQQRIVDDAGDDRDRRHT